MQLTGDRECFIEAPEGSFTVKIREEENIFVMHVNIFAINFYLVGCILQYYVSVLSLLDISCLLVGTLLSDTLTNFLPANIISFSLVPIGIDKK